MPGVLCVVCCGINARTHNIVPAQRRPVVGGSWGVVPQLGGVMGSCVWSPAGAVLTQYCLGQRYFLLSGNLHEGLNFFCL